MKDHIWSGAVTHLSPSAEGSVLSEVIQHSRLWSRERVIVPPRVRRILWLLTAAQLVWTVWLATVATESVRCDGPVCLVATLDGHVTLLLVCAATSLVSLGVLAVSTRGFASAHAGETAGLLPALGVGGVALLGVVALVTVVGIVLVISAVFFGTLTVTW